MTRRDFDIFKKFNNPLLTNSFKVGVPEEIATERFMKLVNYALENNKSPKKNTKLGRYHRNLKVAKSGKSKKKKKRRWYPIFDELLKKHNLEYLFITLEEISVKKFQELINYVLENNETPKQPSKLGSYISTLKLAKKTSKTSYKKQRYNKWYPIYDELLKKHNLEYIFDTLEEIAVKKFQELINYVLENNEIPAQRTKIGTYLNKLKRAKNGKRKWYPIFDELLKKHNVEYIFQSLEWRAEKKFQELINYVLENNEIPKHRTKLGGYFRNLKKAKNGKRKWYPIFDELLKKHNLEYIFEVRK